MKEFIEIIESIGFVKGRRWWTLSNEVGTEWVIEIANGDFMPSLWALSYHSSSRKIKHTSIPLYDRKILNKYFKAQLRESKLNELGIIN